MHLLHFKVVFGCLVPFVFGQSRFLPTLQFPLHSAVSVDFTPVQWVFLMRVSPSVCLAGSLFKCGAFSGLLLRKMKVCDGNQGYWGVMRLVNEKNRLC